MAERRPPLRCPVCLGVSMKQRAIGEQPSLQVDCCKRCGGVWFDHGEVQRLRPLEREELWQHLVPRPRPMRVPCHSCHAPIERSDTACTHCGWTNALDCPVCDQLMLVESHAGLRLDVCRTCKGLWFDHHELKEIWNTHFDLALQKRLLVKGTSGQSTASRAMNEVLFDALFFAPDVVVRGASAGIATAADASAQAAGAIAALPNASGAVFKAAGEAASDVFEAIVGIVADMFG